MVESQQSKHKIYLDDGRIIFHPLLLAEGKKSKRMDKNDVFGGWGWYSLMFINMRDLEFYAIFEFL